MINRNINLQNYHKMQIENKKENAENDFILSQEEVRLRNCIVFQINFYFSEITRAR